MSSGKQGKIFKEKFNMTLFPKIQLREMKSRLRSRSSLGDKSIPKIAIIPPTPCTLEEPVDSIFTYAFQDAIPKTLATCSAPFRRNSEPWRATGKRNDSRKRRPRNERSMSLPEGEERVKDLLQVPTARRRKKTRRGSLSDDQVNMKWITDNAKIDKQVLTFAKPRESRAKLARFRSIQEEAGLERSLSLPTDRIMDRTVVSEDEGDDCCRNTGMLLSPVEGEVSVDSARQALFVRKHSIPSLQYAQRTDRYLQSEVCEMMSDNHCGQDLPLALDDVKYEFVLCEDEAVLPNYSSDPTTITGRSFGNHHKSQKEDMDNSLRPFGSGEFKEQPTNLAEPGPKLMHNKNVPKNVGQSSGFRTFQQGQNLLNKITSELVETISPKKGKGLHRFKSWESYRHQDDASSEMSEDEDMNDLNAVNVECRSQTESPTSVRTLARREEDNNRPQNDLKKPRGLSCLDNLLEALNRTT